MCHNQALVHDTPLGATRICETDLLKWQMFSPAASGEFSCPDCLLVVWSVLDSSAGTNPFWQMGYGWMASILDTVVGGEYVFVKFRGPKFAAGLRLMK